MFRFRMCYFVLCVAFLWFCSLWGAVHAEVLVGELDGSINVDNGGTVSYSMELAVPSGTAHMQPTLNLTYNSKAKNGILGVGFSLGGLSAITRTSTMLLHDKFVDGVDFDDNDRLLLDGQRLMVVPGTASYGKDGAEYRTEINNFSRIRQYGNINDPECFFIVETKAGLIYAYGQDNQSAFAPWSQEIVSWSVNKISDTAGNYMTYHYNNSAFQQVLDYIEYTGNASLDPYCRVEFAYGGRSDKRYSYLNGHQLSLDKRLETVRMLVEEQEAWSYKLEYTTHATTGKSLLQSVQQCFGDDVLPKKKFEWLFAGVGRSSERSGIETSIHSSDSFSQIRVGEFNGDGRMDFYIINPGANDVVHCSDGKGSFSTFSHPSMCPASTKEHSVGHQLSRIHIIDLNGDGISDVYRVNGGSDSIYLGEGDGSFGERIDGPDTSSKTADLPSLVRFGDFNGDGLLDIYALKRQDESSTINYIYYNTGNAEFSPEESGVYFFVDDDVRGANDTNRVKLGDFNGDGLTDIYYYVDDSGRDKIYLCGNDGKFSPSRYYYAINTPNRDGPRESTAIENAGYIASVRFADFNGDGLTDIYHVQETEVTDKIYLSKGDGTFAEYDGLAGQPDGKDNGSIKLADLNGDGLTDIYFIKHWVDDTRPHDEIYFSNGDGTFKAPVKGCSAVIPDGFIGFNDADRQKVYNFNIKRILLLDFDGDGINDIYQIKGYKSSEKDRVRITSYPPPLLERISDERSGRTTEITYDTLMNPEVYNEGPAKAYPLRSVLGPMYVPTKIGKDDGVGGVHYSHFTYSGGVSHRDRGFLGFGQFESYNEQTKIHRLELLRQDFPYTGSPFQIETAYMPDPSLDSTSAGYRQILSRVENLYDVKTFPSKSSFPYIYESTESKWDLGEEDEANKLSEAKTHNNFDNYGNLEEVQVWYDDQTALKTINQYDNTIDANKWYLGRLRNSTVQHYREDPAFVGGVDELIRYSEFEYDPDTGLLRWEREEPGNAEEWKVTEFQYDDYGNIEKKIITGAEIEERVVQYNDYDERGRFIEGAYNAMGHHETLVSDPILGSVTSQTGPNELTTTRQYDRLGRLEIEKRPNQTATTNSYAWVASRPSIFGNDYVRFAVTDPSSGTEYVQKALYKTVSQSSGAPPQIVYFDSHKREIRTESRSPEGWVILQDRAYNSVGHCYAISEPYFKGETIRFAYSMVDELGRPDLLTAVDLTQTKYIYEGMKTTTIANFGDGIYDETEPDVDQKTVSIKNAKGQVIEIIDNHGKSMKHLYDAAGNLFRTIDCGVEDGAPVNTVEMHYDLRGNKIKLIDPDMGTWDYEHNVLGELVWQKNARGDVTKIQYDKLGRIELRTTWIKQGAELALETTAEWTYDNTATGGWLGALHQEILTDGSGSLVYRKTHSYDSLGRPMVELINFDDKWFYSYYAYDKLGRNVLHNRYWRPQGLRGPESNQRPEWNLFGLRNSYGKYSIVETVSDSSGHIWWNSSARDIDARGRLLKYRFGNQTVTENTFDPLTGRLDTSTCKNSSSDAYDIAANTYDFDRMGNLVQRLDSCRKVLQEDFTYDGLNRLRTAQVYGGTLLETTYDNLGNIKTKTGIAGEYQYGERGAGPHAVTTAGGVSYLYDENGSMTFRGQLGGDYTLRAEWNTFGKTDFISTGEHQWSRFTYDIGHNRITQIKRDGEQVVKQLYINGMEQEEKLLSDPDQELEANWQWELAQTRVFVSTPSGTIGIHVQDADSERVTRKYLHKDHLGSITVVTGDQNTTTRKAPILAEYSYDAWGARRDAQTWEPLTSSLEPQVSSHSAGRGFTGHEMLDHLGLVHMNGRIYDQNLGRFLSADPFIQAPHNIQSYNRYAYVINNPLTLTDPSGYNWLSDKWHDFHEFLWDVFTGQFIVDNWVVIRDTLISVALCWIFTPVGAAMIMNVARTGTISMYTFAAAGTSIASGYAGSSVLSGVNGFFKPALEEITLTQRVAQVASRGITGGIVSVARGDSFGKGYLASYKGLGLLDVIKVGVAVTAATISAAKKFFAGDSPVEKSSGANGSDGQKDGFRGSEQDANLRISKVMRTYSISTKGKLKSVRYNPRYAGDGQCDSSKGIVEIGRAGMNGSDGWLGSTLAHEIEMHLALNHLGDATRLVKWGNEVTAYQYEIDNADRFGLTASELSEVTRRRDYYQGRIDELVSTKKMYRDLR